jgi:hypothetical protein
MKYGYTLSQGYAGWLGVDWKECVVRLQQNFPFEVVRLPLYWKDIETRKDFFDWSSIDQQWEFLESKNLSVVPCIGVRQPRWPEWYAPKYTKILSKDALQERILIWLYKFVERYVKIKNLDFVQVENEPFEHQWGADSLDMSAFLETEVIFLKSKLPSTKLIVTYPYKPWSPKIPFESNFNADIFGVDLYTRAYVRWKKFGMTVDIGVFEGLVKKQIAGQIKDYSQDFWITELQAEPWADKVLTELKYPSKFMSPKIFERNLRLAKSYNPEVVLVWGVEWWGYRGLIDQYTDILRTL